MEVPSCICHCSLNGAGILDANTIQVLTVDTRVRVRQVHVIEGVECLDDQLQSQGLTQREVLRHRSVHVRQARSAGANLMHLDSLGNERRSTRRTASASCAKQTLQ
jgi:hypothetical protein